MIASENVKSEQQRRQQIANRCLNRSAGCLGILFLVLFIMYWCVAYFTARLFFQLPYDVCQHAENRPDRYEVLEKAGVRAALANGSYFDTRGYLTTRGYTTVKFPARRAASAKWSKSATIEGWLVQGDLGMPAVVLVHGWGECKGKYEVLIPGAALAKRGYTVLWIDVRRHGNSTGGGNFVTWGNEEHNDVLGAVDYLVRAHGFEPSQVGLFGSSMGGAIVTVAMGVERAIPAAWVDSPVCRPLQLLEEHASEYLAALAGVVAQAVKLIVNGWASGDMEAFVPASKAAYIPAQGDAAGRFYHVTHAQHDDFVPYHHGKDCWQAAWRSELPPPGDQPNPTADTEEFFWWSTSDARVGHVRTMLYYPDEYGRRLVAYFDKALIERAPARLPTTPPL